MWACLNRSPPPLGAPGAVHLHPEGVNGDATKRGRHLFGGLGLGWLIPVLLLDLHLLPKKQSAAPLCGAIALCFLPTCSRRPMASVRKEGVLYGRRHAKNSHGKYHVNGDHTGVHHIVVCDELLRAQTN